MSERPEIERAGKAALAKITEQLAWRGPNGKTMGHVVLKREVADALQKYIDDLIEQLAEHEADLDTWMADEREAGGDP